MRGCITNYQILNYTLSRQFPVWSRRKSTQIIMEHQLQSFFICPVCEGTDIQLILEIQQVPAHCNLLWPERELALKAPRGDIHLGYCSTCTHIYNFAFDPRHMEYDQAYENSLHFSPHVQDCANSLASDLIDRYALHSKTIIEIGSGKGDFLIMLAEMGNNRGLGFDPSYEPDLAGHRSERVTFIQDFYSEKYVDLEPDLVCCRHVLEHIYKPSAFLTNIRRAIGEKEGTAVFFEVPNVKYTLVDLGIWDIIYEHCSYFNKESLIWLFSSTDFHVRDVRETFSGQFLTIDAIPGSRNGPNSENAKEISQHVALFSLNYQQKVSAWCIEIDKIKESRQKAVVWGAGSKGVSFLNTLNAERACKYVVDLNPRKQGMFVAGTGQKIVSPDFLKEYQPDLVVIMNPNYENEIRQMLAGMDLAPICRIA